MKKNNNQKSKKKKVLYFLLMVLMVLAAGSAVRFRFFVVMSGSMEPVLPVGTIIIVNTGCKEAEPGEIVTFCMGETIVTHRTVGKEGDWYITKGDANDEPDSVRIHQDRIIGTVCGWIPVPEEIIFCIRKTGFIVPVLMVCLVSFSAAAGKCAKVSEKEKRRKKYEKN